MALIKKYDTFIFFNELELLEIRLNILNDFVDYFILVESTKTFTGLDKPLYYLENKNMAYFDFIIDIKTKLFNKEYIKAETELANVIFNGINVDGYEQ